MTSIDPLIQHLDEIHTAATEIEHGAYQVIRDAVPESDHAGWEREIKEYCDAIKSAEGKCYLALRELEHAAWQRRVA